MKKCMGCMRDYAEDRAECPVCGYSDNCRARDARRFPDALPPATILGGRYILGRTLACSDFSIVYMAWDALLQKRVAVREYLPYGLARRGADGTEVVFPGTRARELFSRGMERFESEARLLWANQDVHAIVETYRCLRENGTSYIVTEYLEGCTLRDLTEGTAPWTASASEVLAKLEEAVALIHDRGIGHFNLTPDNIYIDERGDVRLLDFGGAKKELRRLTGRPFAPLEDDFVAPEVRAGGDADLRADDYSLERIRELLGRRGERKTDRNELQNSHQNTQSTRGVARKLKACRRRLCVAVIFVILLAGLSAFLGYRTYRLTREIAAQTEEPVTEQPQTETPVTEQPQTETPVTEQPQTETLATDRPQTETTPAETSAAKRTQTETPVTDRTPAQTDTPEEPRTTEGEQA